MIFNTENFEHIPFTGIGRNDCFALVRGFFLENFNIKLTNVARPHDWKSDKLDLFRTYHEREGFSMICDWKPKDLVPGDILCMAIGEANANHLAIYVGDGDILHHLYGRASSREVFRDFWRNSTCYILRHKDVPDLRPVRQDIDIVSIIRARNAPPTE